MHLRATHIWQNCEGSVAIEAALFFTVMLFAFIGFIDYSAVANSKLQLSATLQMASAYALSEPNSTADLTTIIGHASPELPTVTASASQFCQCSGSTVACGSSCSSGLETYTLISASVSVPLLLSYPGFENPFPLTDATSIRVQ